MLFASLTLIPLSAKAASVYDSDGDGITDVIEGSSDADGDGVPNHFDTDSDGDGLSDQFEGADDADGDNIPNFLDLDSDADGMEDSVEGGFDSFEKVAVSSALLDAVATGLPESKAVDAAFLNPAYPTDLTLREDAAVQITFLNEGAGYRNSLGYYIYQTGAFDGLTKADIDLDGSGVVSTEEILQVSSVEIGWVFPNASKANGGGSLLAGDSATLGNGRVFARGTTVGFFLVQNAWLGSSVRQPNSDGTRPQTFYTTDFLNPEAPADADLSTNSADNRMRHVALMYSDSTRQDIIMGFEDLHRVNRLMNDNGYGSDEDFNDAVFTIKTNPESALNTTGIATVSGDQPDSDGDGVLDINEQPGDTDGDGTLDINDPDDDGDGIVTPAEGTDDPDGDGTANYLDTDSDNDGISDTLEGARDTDLDGTPDFLDTDSDGDSIPDSVEGSVDTDGDGIPDSADADDDGDGIPTIEEGTDDFDQDGIADYLDTDSDNDSINDGDEVAGDTDGDGALDRYDTDDDGDGILSIVEGSLDSDGDGIGNQADLDSDNDGFTDDVEGDIDSDGDGIVNRIDSDDDNDGIATALEGGEDIDGDGLGNYLDTDSDGDGITDDLDFVSLTATTRAIQLNYTGKPLVPGDQIEYTVTISNNGMQSATNVDIDGLVPSHTTLVPGSLHVDGIPLENTLDSVTALQLAALLAEQVITLTFTVTVNDELPSELNKITSAVSVTSLESAFPAISDNDSTGHSGIEDDGLDSSSDADVYTNDDDPTELPLMQGTVFERCTLAFEDLQNAGWNDWDMNDIVLDISTYYVVDENNNIESLVATYQILARGAGMDSQLNLTLPYSGYGAWQRIYLAQDGSIEDSEIGASTDGATIQLWKSSRDALPAYTDLKYKWGAARTERFDDSAAGKIAVVTIYFDSPVANPLATFSESPHDTWAFIPGTEQEIHRMKYNLASSQIVYQGPLFGRSLPFVIKLESDFTWPAEGQAIWNSHPDYVPFIKSGGTANLEWADTIDIWRVWFDREGKMPGRDELNKAASHPIYLNYVNQHSTSK